MWRNPFEVACLKDWKSRSLTERTLSDRDCPITGRSGIWWYDDDDDDDDDGISSGVIGWSGISSVEAEICSCRQSAVTSTSKSTSLKSTGAGLFTVSDVSCVVVVTVGGDGCRLVGGGVVVESLRRSSTADAGACSDRQPLDPLERR